jgi:ADP-heptose:LPS heptosyltransferase
MWCIHTTWRREETIVQNLTKEDYDTCIDARQSIYANLAAELLYSLTFLRNKYFAVLPTSA